MLPKWWGPFRCGVHDDDTLLRADGGCEDDVDDAGVSTPLGALKLLMV